MPINKAKNVIFVLLAGAPSHTDLFDFKYLKGTTPDATKPDTIKGTLWPMGILPKLGAAYDDLAIIRSMQSHALVHSLAQTWTQIGRNPAGVLGDVSPGTADAARPGFTVTERSRILSLGPWPPPAAAQARVDAAATPARVDLGERLFHSARLAGGGGQRWTRRRASVAWRCWTPASRAGAC